MARVRDTGGPEGECVEYKASIMGDDRYKGGKPRAFTTYQDSRRQWLRSGRRKKELIDHTTTIRLQYQHDYVLKPPAVCFVSLTLEFSHTLLVDGDGGADTTLNDSPVAVVGSFRYSTIPLMATMVFKAFSEASLQGRVYMSL